MSDFMLQKVLISLIVTTGFVLVAYSPICRAIGKRIMHGEQPPDGSTLVVDDARVDQLSSEVAALRRQLDETHDRLDFAERMLAQHKERAAIGGPREA